MIYDFLIFEVSCKLISLTFQKKYMKNTRWPLFSAVFLRLSWFLEYMYILFDGWRYYRKNIYLFWKHVGNDESEVCLFYGLSFLHSVTLSVCPSSQFIMSVCLLLSTNIYKVDASSNLAFLQAAPPSFELKAKNDF